MSDFDREAEREKLREKYERDKQKREASERMSELLLQGATMTNRHCPECHSPVFRYEGREFCPTCQKEVTEDGELLDTGAEADGESPPADAESAASGAEAETGGDTATADAGEPRSDPDPAADPDSEPDPDPAPDAERDPDRTRASEPGTDDATTSPPTPARDRHPARVDPPARREGREDREKHRRSAPEEGGDLREAEALLRDEVLSLTRRAEETRDVGRKRDLLAAAKEAAETLEVVRRL